LSRTLHALIQEGIDSGEFRQGGRSRSTSPAGSTGSQERYRQEFVLCSACACKHMEGAGPGVRPFRKTDSHAKVIAFHQFKGWDPVYWASKSEQVGKIMADRMRKVNDSKIRLEGDQLRKFEAAVAEARLKKVTSKA
jgi:hypothetical protein